MKKINDYVKYFIPALIIVCICCYLFCCYFNSPGTTVILVRHADRTGNVDVLNSSGTARAQELARILDETNVSVIYTSTANRTQQTAIPLATQLGISITTYDTGNLPSLASEIKSSHKGKVILVVGHSNTVPETINLLGILPTLSDIPHDEYDNLYIVILAQNSIPNLLKMEYGADTP